MTTALATIEPAEHGDAAPRRRLYRLRKHLPLVVGALLLVAVVVLALGAPWIAPDDPGEIDPLARLLAPSVAHYFGTDALGRDVFSRAAWGGRMNCSATSYRRSSMNSTRGWRRERITSA